MFDQGLINLSQSLQDLATEKKIRVVTAESCTGGLVGGLITELAGSSNFFERGFVVYSNHAPLLKAFHSKIHY